MSIDLISPGDEPETVPITAVLDQGALKQIAEWLHSDYGVDYAFEFRINGDEGDARSITIGHYKKNGDGNRYLVCSRCGGPRDRDRCENGWLVPAREWVHHGLTSLPPIPIRACTLLR
jgi:hypothetical protein